MRPFAAQGGRHPLCMWPGAAKCFERCWLLPLSCRPCSTCLRSPQVLAQRAQRRRMRRGGVVGEQLQQVGTQADQKGNACRAHARRVAARGADGASRIVCAHAAALLLAKRLRAQRTMHAGMHVSMHADMCCAVKRPDPPALCWLTGSSSCMYRGLAAASSLSDRRCSSSAPLLLLLLLWSSPAAAAAVGAILSCQSCTAASTAPPATQCKHAGRRVGIRPAAATITSQQQQQQLLTLHAKVACQQGEECKAARRRRQAAVRGHQHLRHLAATRVSW